MPPEQSRGVLGRSIAVATCWPRPSVRLLTDLPPISRTAVEIRGGRAQLGHLATLAVGTG